jgi:NADH-quinone oxidoreductase subunit N
VNFAFLQDFGPLGVLLLGAVACLGAESGLYGSRADRARLSRWIAVAFTALAFLAAVGFWRSSLGPAPPDVEHGSFLVDRFALFFYAAAPAAAAAILLAGSDLEEQLDPHQPLYHALVLVSTSGVMLTASGADLLTLLVGLATVSLPLVLGSALRKVDPGTVRSAARSFVVSGALLATFAAGEAILAGLGHATQLTLLEALPPSPLLGLAALLITVGVAGPLGAFPFTWWRVGAAKAVPLGPSLAGLSLGALAAAAALLRLLPGTLSAAIPGWNVAVGVVAALTILIAPALAWRQRSLLAAVGYLFVGDAALVLVGVTWSSRPATAAVLYLVLGLVPVATASLGLLGTIQLSGAGDGIAQLRGLASRSPLHSGLLALLLAAVVGLPPLTGFFARIMVVESSLQAGLGWLAVAVVLGSVISAAVALRWALALVDPQAEGQPLELPSRATLVGLGLSVAALAGFTVTLGPLMGIAGRAALAPLAGP